MCAVSPSLIRHGLVSVERVVSISWASCFPFVWFVYVAVFSRSYTIYISYASMIYSLSVLKHQQTKPNSHLRKRMQTDIRAVKTMNGICSPMSFLIACMARLLRAYLCIVFSNALRRNTLTPTCKYYCSCAGYNYDSTATQPFDDLRYARRQATCCGLLYWGLNK